MSVDQPIFFFREARLVQTGCHQLDMRAAIMALFYHEFEDDILLPISIQLEKYHQKRKIVERVERCFIEFPCI